MKNPNELKKSFSFQPYELDTVSAYLEDMALQGWKLISVKDAEGRQGWRQFFFEKAEPQKVHYAAKPPTAVCPGWDFVCSTEVFHVFVSAEEFRPPFVMDEKEERQTVVSETIRQNILAWLFCILLTILFYIRFSRDMGNSILTSYFSLFLFPLSLFPLVFLLMSVGKLIVWAIRHRRGIVSRKPASRMWMRKKLVVVIIVVWLAGFGFMGVDGIVSSAAKARTDSLILYNATFLASEGMYRHTFMDGEEKSFTVLRSNIGFILNCQLKAEMRRSNQGSSYEKELDPAPLGAIRMVECSNRIYIIYDRLVIVSGTYRQEPLTPAQVEEILLLQ